MSEPITLTVTQWSAATFFGFEPYDPAMKVWMAMMVGLNDPDIIEALTAALVNGGYGITSVRTQDVHVSLGEYARVAKTLILTFSTVTDAVAFKLRHCEKLEFVEREQ